ncbi:helix-turn-helix domain-containing protein [Bacillus sp. RO1]|uniref:helix-turn-helix domain-containing protein n=1 Tax=Bacillus sp. RO1 TaxID=2722703 RepID=UPI0014573DF7|nr:helix-turn-helix domain-containing protein [Bacillus sp. RO1]NLP49571.1 Rrf2 family transcriptional regulator [Bacillus sp. RO1]
MNSFEYLCLKCLQSFRGERSISAIYHLFRGKKSSQTIQDANIFALVNVYGLFPDLNRNSLQQSIQILQTEQLIREVHSEHFELTHKGENQLVNGEKLFNLAPYLNGYAYKDKSLTFWKRYSLLVQTLSNLAGKESTFIPIQYDDHIQSWVKNYLLSQKGSSKKRLLKDLFIETNGLLTQLPANKATVFTLKLSGYRHAGNTDEQIARTLKTDIAWIHIEFQSALHYIIQRLEEKDAVSTYKHLFLICRDFLEKSLLTETTQKTLKLLHQGFTLEEIANIRRLKESTIEDHIVEISMQIHDFSIAPYVKGDDVQAIKAVISDLQTHQLRKIKEKLKNFDINYFQIRLVLTRMGDRDESRQPAGS